MAQRLKCAVCGRDYYDSVIGKCPKRPDKIICMYCCMTKCKNSYRVEGQIGQRCRATEREKEKAKTGEKKQ